MRNEAITFLPKSAPFMVSKDEWDRKEYPGKSMKNALYVHGMAKGTSRAEVTSNSNKISPVALAIVKLCESDSEAVSQSVSQSC